MASIEAISKSPQITIEVTTSPLEENLKIAQIIIEKTVADLPIGAANTVKSIASRKEVYAMRSTIYDRATIADPLIQTALICLQIYTAYSLFVFEGGKENPSILAYAISTFAADYFLRLSLSPTLFDEVRLRLISHIAKSFGVGNCGEHAQIALEHLKKMTTTNGEVVADYANDHVFLVIDRDPNSSINDPKTWGNRAVVCDPWARQSFPAHELKEKLAHILATHLYPPMPSLNENNFQVMGSYNKNILLSYISNIFSNVVCADLHLGGALKAVEKNLEALKNITSQIAFKSLPSLLAQTA